MSKSEIERVSRIWVGESENYWVSQKWASESEWVSDSDMSEWVNDKLSHIVREWVGWWVSQKMSESVRNELVSQKWLSVFT